MAVFAARTPQSPPLSVELNVFKFPDQRYRAHVTLINEGDKPITVFSQYMTIRMGQSAEAQRKGKQSIRLELGTTKVHWEGHEYRASKYRYFPVELQPGQCTKYEFTEPFGNPLNEIDDGVKKVRVVYKVTPEIGKQYGIWSGEAKSAWFEVNRGEIQPNE